MSRAQESYRDSNLVVEETGEELRLFVDGRRVNVIQSADGYYSSEGLYYTKYASLIELGRAIVDARVPQEEP